MTPNVNPDTGIRYGVMSLRNLDPDTVDWLWSDGHNVSEEEALEELRAEIAKDVENERDDRGDDPLSEEDMEVEIERRFEAVAQDLQIEEPYIEGECEGVKYGISWLGGAPLLWVYWSPFTTHARLCSPCVPNAGDLDSLDPENGFECYDVPADWRVK